MSEGISKEEKRWQDHSKFQGRLTEHIGYAMIATEDNRIDAISDLVEFLLYEGMKHENKHCQDAETPPLLREIDKEGDRVKEYPQGDMKPLQGGRPW